MYDSLYWIMCDGSYEFQYRNEKVTHKFTLLFYFIFYVVNVTSVGLWFEKLKSNNAVEIMLEQYIHHANLCFCDLIYMYKLFFP